MYIAVAVTGAMLIPWGELLGRILVDGGVANFCFGREGEIFLLNEYPLWRVQLRGGAKGALLKIEILLSFKLPSVQLSSFSLPSIYLIY
jgi:hypothetical protein